MADVAPVTVSTGDVGGQEEEEEDWDGEYEEEEEEDDLAAYAEQAKRAIEEQLFSSETGAQAPAPPPQEVPPNPKEQAAVATVRAILASLEHDSVALSTLTTSKVPEFGGDGLLDILRNIAGSGKIPRGVALPISRALVTLAKSAVLFGSLRHSDAPSAQLKRKREEADADEHANKRLRISTHPLHVEVAEAVSVISQTITTSQTLGPPVIASIQPQLHRVFLFAVSSSAVPGPNTNALQELSGLIQVLGVLSGTQIGQESQNILTAVYPCLSSGCGKFFARLYSLRAHQRIHSTWKCAACAKVFPRRDAIEKHKSAATDACASAEIVEVSDGENARISPGRRHSEEAEEGELEVDMIFEIQTTVLELHPLLQTHVARALGASAGQTTSSSSSTNGQATLASVIAQAQLTQARRVTNEPSATDVLAAVYSSAPAAVPAPPAGDSASLSVYGLSDEQTKQVKEAINNAASAAQAEAEAQAALEEDEGANSIQPPPT